MRKIALAFGILILLSGILLMAISQSTNEIPQQENETKALRPDGQPAEVINQTGMENLSVQTIFATGRVFRVEFALKNFPLNFPEESLAIYTNVTDPLGYLTQRYVLMAPNPQNPYQWVLVPGGDWNMTSVANSTGTYGVSIFPELPVVTFARLTVYEVTVVPGEISYPYSYLFYGGVPVFVAGLVLSVYGVYGKTERVRRTRREK